MSDDEITSTCSSDAPNAPESDAHASRQRALAAWHTEFLVAHEARKHDARTITEHMRLPEVPRFTVQSWINGEDAPRTDAIHTRLLEALGIHESEKPLATQVRQAMKAAHQKLLTVGFDSAPTSTIAHSHITNLARPQTPKRHTIVHNGAQKHVPNPMNEVKYNSAPPRIHNDESIAYRTLDKRTLIAILRETTSPHEYLTAARAISGAARSDLPHEVGLAAREVEWGTALVTSEVLRKLKPYFGETGVFQGDYQHFKHLAIAERLTVMMHTDDPCVLKSHFKHLPTEFWRAALDKKLHGDPLHNLPENEHADAKKWIHLVPDITHKGDYIRAIRCYLDLPTKALGSGEWAESSLSMVERGSYTLIGDNTQSVIFHEIGAFLRKQQAAHSELPAFYDEQLFNTLPSTSACPYKIPDGKGYAGRSV